MYLVLYSLVLYIILFYTCINDIGLQVDISVIWTCVVCSICIHIVDVIANTDLKYCILLRMWDKTHYEDIVIQIHANQAVVLTGIDKKPFQTIFCFSFQFIAAQNYIILWLFLMWCLAKCSKQTLAADFELLQLKITSFYGLFRFDAMQYLFSRVLSL